MADITTILIDEVSYNIKDASADTRLDSVEADVASLDSDKADKSEIIGFKKITISSTPPTSEQGSDGDIWLVY